MWEIYAYHGFVENKRETTFVLCFVMWVTGNALVTPLVFQVPKGGLFLPKFEIAKPH